MMRSSLYGRLKGAWGTLLQNVPNLKSRCTGLHVMERSSFWWHWGAPHEAPSAGIPKASVWKMVTRCDCVSSVPLKVNDKFVDCGVIDRGQ